MVRSPIAARVLPVAAALVLIAGCSAPDINGDPFAKGTALPPRNNTNEDSTNPSDTTEGTPQTQSTNVDAGAPLDASADAAPKGPLKAFVSSTLVTGNLGGVAGADAICNKAAKDAGLPGTFIAWISTSQVNAIDRVTGSGPWQLVNGTEVFKTKADLTKGSLAAAFRRDEKNAQPPLDEDRVWTGTNAAGTVATHTCNDWGGTGGSGRVGEAEQTNNGWTALTDEACTEVNRVYCLQQ